MQSYARPLFALVDGLSWFVRAKEVRLVHVVADADLRPGVLKAVAAAEFHADNASPFLLLEDDGWAERAERARALHEARREAMPELAELPPRPAGRAPELTFALQLQQIERASCPPLEGLVAVLAPTRVDDPEQWQAVLEQLVTAPTLSAIRWIIVDIDASTIGRLSKQAFEIECRVNRDEEKRDLDAMLDALAASPRQSPMAWPRGVVPPARKNAPPAGMEIESASALEETQRKILGAAKAAREQRGPEAIRLQRGARDVCLGAGLLREATLCELVLGTYLIQFGSRDKAAEIFADATRRASDAGLMDLAAQAQMAAGTLALGRKDLPHAAGAYARAAELAQAAGSAILAIECWRMAGHAAAEGENIEAATRCWRSALDAADAAPPVEVKASSAAETARTLAALCKRRGLSAQAEALLAQADRFETGQGEPAAQAEAEAK